MKKKHKSAVYTGQAVDLVRRLLETHFRHLRHVMAPEPDFDDEGAHNKLLACRDAAFKTSHLYRRATDYSNFEGV